MNTILLTFDVEDWFQVENLKPFIPFSSWQNYELRIERNVHKILNLLDSIRPVRLNNQISQIDQIKEKNQIVKTDQNSLLPTSCYFPSRALRLTPHDKIKGTFFVLAWLGQRLPHLVREIYNRGHEVASHGYNHRLCREESLANLKADLEKSKKLLEDITGNSIYGYRAPNFSINSTVLNVIKECGYLYDSSYNSYRLNKRYGEVEIFNGHNGFPYKLSDEFYEIPISNLKIGKLVLHWGGGGYFRLIPIKLFTAGVNSILKKSGVYTFYLHPWELDPEQPKMNDISNFLKFRHYYNLQKTANKLKDFLNFFKVYRFLTCHDFLKMHFPLSSIKN